MQNFDKNDWDWLAGAERPDKDRLPQIGEMIVNSENNEDISATIVVDKSGIEIVWLEEFTTEEFGNDNRDRSLHLNVTYDLGLLIAEKLENQGWAESYLKTLGFKDII